LTNIIPEIDFFFFSFSFSFSFLGGWMLAWNGLGLGRTTGKCFGHFVRLVWTKPPPSSSGFEEGCVDSQSLYQGVLPSAAAAADT